MGEESGKSKHKPTVLPRMRLSKDFGGAYAMTHFVVIDRTTGREASKVTTSREWAELCAARLETSPEARRYFVRSFTRAAF